MFYGQSYAHDASVNLFVSFKAFFQFPFALAAMIFMHKAC